MKTPFHTAKTLKYSYDWAERVVNRLLDEYARVSPSFIELSGLTPRTLARVLASGSDQWRNVKLLIKTLALWRDKSPESVTTTQLYSDLLKFFTRTRNATAFEVLTARLSRLMLKEPCEKGPPALAERTGAEATYPALEFSI